MPSYLIRKKNRFGQYVHLETINFEPDDELLKNRFGFGVYNVVIAIEGVAGLKSFKNYTITPEYEIIGFYPIKPTVEELRELHGNGDYFISRVSNTKVNQIRDPNIPLDEHDEVFKMLQGFAPSLNGYLVFKIKWDSYFNVIDSISPL